MFLNNWSIENNYSFILIDLGAYSLPIATSICWLISEEPSLPLTAFSIILVNFKLLLFFRVIQSYGKYFAIIIGVASEVFPFLVVLFFIIFGFGFAFFILLRSGDANDPWNLTTQFSYVNSDGTMNSTPAITQIPDSNTNMFNWFPTSILAMYLLLTGNIYIYFYWICY